MPRSCVYQFRHARVEQKYRPAWASNNCAPPQPSPPIASPHRRTTEMPGDGRDYFAAGSLKPSYSMASTTAASRTATILLPN
jgi:hypothetical protein